MIKTLLNQISQQPNDTIVLRAWLTGQTGEIVDLQNNCIFRFIEYIDSPELRKKHTTEESQLSCPIVACGLVGYWLHKKDSEGTKAIFEGYYTLRLKEYEKAHEGDDDAWERDFKKEFACCYHIPREKKQIKLSEALFAYITENDQKKIKSITDNYLKFARTKRKELYPPKHPANRMIEDTFLDAYRRGGPAYECMSWMRTEYNLPYMGPHWHKLSKTGDKQLSGKWKELHERVTPEYIAEGYEDFDGRVLRYANGGLMDEIDENFKKCQTEEDRIRYIISLLQPFKEFADAFYAKARIDERKRSIEECEKWIKEWEIMPDDAVDDQTGKQLRPKDQISACKSFIERYNQDIIYWEKVQDDFYWFAQHGLGGGDYREYPQEVNDEMCTYLGVWWESMIFFARRLAALALTYGIKLMDVQERCEVYLMRRFRLHDYVDNKYITSTEHARKLLDEIEAKKPKSEVNSKVDTSANKEEAENRMHISNDFKPNLNGQNRGSSIASKQSNPGRKKTSFNDYVINKDDSNWVIKLIKKQINIDKPKQVALVIIGGIETGIIREDVSAPSIEREFGVKGNSVKPHLTIYRSTRGKPNPRFSENELKPYKNLFLSRNKQ